MPLSAALTTAARSMDLFSLGIQVSGNNISNAHTPGYVRNSLIIEEGKPYQQGNLLIGTGAFAVGIRRDVDAYLEGRIVRANGDLEQSRSLSDAYKQLEDTLGSLGDNDLSAQLTDFIASVQAVVNQPENGAIRGVTIDQGQSFAQNIQALRGKLNDLADATSVQVEAVMTQANDLINSIAKLNPQISQMEANGLAQNDASGLRNQRAQAISQLSELLPIRVTDRPDGGVDIFSGTDYLILGGTVQNLETVVTSQNGVIGTHVQTTKTHSLADNIGGKLTGLIEGRDAIVQGFSSQLDEFTAATIYEFNRIHASGEGTAGFTSVTGTYAAGDVNAALNSAGLAFNPQNGSFQLKVLNTGTGLTETTNVAVDLNGVGSETSLTSLAANLDAIDHISASITADGRLQITSDAGFEFRFANDTSGTLASLGINTFFTGSDATDIAVNDVLRNDSRFLATGQGGGPSDNRNAVLLAQAFDKSVSGLNNLTISEYLNRAKADVGQKSAAQSALADGLQSFRDALSTQRDQSSGVNLDEELIKILQFQHSYQAAARIVSTVEQLMNTLLQM